MILSFDIFLDLHVCKPRASGDDPEPNRVCATSDWVNPARAGMIRRKSATPDGRTSKPRASGDDPAAASDVTSMLA